jgi:hypothetical protein
MALGVYQIPDASPPFWSWLTVPPEATTAGMTPLPQTLNTMSERHLTMILRHLLSNRGSLRIVYWSSGSMKRQDTGKTSGRREMLSLKEEVTRGPNY